MSWQPIETAPRDGTDILLSLNGEVYLGHFSDTERRSHGEVTYHRQFWYLGNYLSFGNPDPVPTHWMAIPNPPDAP